LGQEIEPVWEPIYEDIIHLGEEFSFGIRSRSPSAGPLAIEWYGVISHRPPRGPHHGHTCADVLLFAQDKRLISFKGEEYLYFELTATPEGFREWQSRGWRSGECGEWEGYQRLSEVCRRMREAQESRTYRMAGLESVAELIENYFNDGALILEIVEAEDYPSAAPDPARRDGSLAAGY
jgi:hypothetical protein